MWSLSIWDASNADGSDAAVNIRIETVNAVLKSKTESYDYRYVDLFSQMVVTGTLRIKTDYVSDGVHPNDEGKKFIASVIGPIIIEMLDQSQK